MTGSKSLIFVLGPWFKTKLDGLPAMIRTRIEADFFPMPWDQLSPEQRRRIAEQWDERHAPGGMRAKELAWGLVVEKARIESQIAELQGSLTPTSTDIAKKETRLNELKQDLVRIEWLLHHAPMVSPSSTPQDRGFDPTTRYVPFPIAFEQLRQRLAATAEELAAWVFIGPGNGGIAAYVGANDWVPQPSPPSNHNDSIPPQRFFFDISLGEDYVAPLMACWFAEDEISVFKPRDRFITGVTLTNHWRLQSHIQPEAFISAKIAESRLIDIHPILGRTQAGFPEHHWLPPAGSGLFRVADVEAIEAVDFDTRAAAHETRRNRGRPRDPSALKHQLTELRSDAIHAARSIPDPTREKVASKLARSDTWCIYSASTILPYLRAEWWKP